jgi:hypothetical protein
MHIDNLHTVLIIAGFVCFVAATLGVTSPKRFNLVAAGLALLTATLIF